MEGEGWEGGWVVNRKFWDEWWVIPLSLTHAHILRERKRGREREHKTVNRATVPRTRTVCEGRFNGRGGAGTNAAGDRRSESHDQTWRRPAAQPTDCSPMTAAAAESGSVQEMAAIYRGWLPPLIAPLYLISRISGAGYRVALFSAHPPCPSLSKQRRKFATEWRRDDSEEKKKIRSAREEKKNRTRHIAKSILALAFTLIHMLAQTHRFSYTCIYIITITHKQTSKLFLFTQFVYLIPICMRDFSRKFGDSTNI